MEVTRYYKMMIDTLRNPENFVENYVDPAFFGKVADALEQLSRRETPMKVRVTTSTKRCPSCNKQVSGRGNIHPNYRYCRWCGQALDWSDNNAYFIV